MPLATFLKAPLKPAAASLPGTALEEAESCLVKRLLLFVASGSSSSDACACTWYVLIVCILCVIACLQSNEFKLTVSVYMLIIHIHTQFAKTLRLMPLKSMSVSSTVCMNH